MQLRSFLDRGSQGVNAIAVVGRLDPSAVVARLDPLSNPGLAFFSERDQIRDALEVLVATVIPPLDDMKEDLSFLQARLHNVDLASAQLDATDANYYRRFQVANIRLEQLEAASEKLGKAQLKIKPFIQFLESLKNASSDQALRLPSPQSGLLLQASVSCQDLPTGSTTMDPLSFSIDYQSDLRISVSGGLVASTLVHRSFDIEKNSAGADVIAESDISPQVIPFIFADLRLKAYRLHGTLFTVNATPGLD